VLIPFLVTRFLVGLSGTISATGSTTVDVDDAWTMSEL